jgi:hypothetical protein
VARHFAGAVAAVRLYFYVGCGAILAVVILGWEDRLLPVALAVRVGHNSEVFALALLLGGVVDLGRPWWVRRGRPRTPVWVLSAVLAAGAALVVVLDVPASVRTLHEPILAAAVLTPYLALRRPLARRWRFPALLAALLVAAPHVPILETEAEALTAILAATISFDLVDRSLLEPDQRAGRWRWVWLAGLAVWPALMLAADDRGVSGLLGTVVNVQARGAEGYWGVLLVHAFLLVVRSAEWRSSR